MKLSGALLPLLLVSRALGVFPGCPVLYSGGLFLFLVGSQVYLASARWQTSRYTMRQASDLSQTLGKFLCYSFCVPVCLGLRSRFLELLTKVRVLDAELGHGLLEYTRLHRILVLKLALGLVLSLSSNLKAVSRAEDLEDVLYACATDFFIYTVLVVGIQFITFISVCSTFFGAINDRLESYEDDDHGVLTDINKAQICPVPTRIQVLECQLSEFGYRAALGSARTTRSPDGIRVLMRLQDETCDITAMVNSTYSLQLLASLAVVFVTLTVHTYAIISSLVDTADDVGNDTTPFLAISVLFQAVQLLWLTHACSATADQANRTAVLVHKLLTKTTNPGLKEELEMFSLQLLHRNVHFTACGFFPVDFTLLYSIVGAVTTYLVILIQFQLSFNQPSGSSVSHNKTSQ